MQENIVLGPPRIGGLVIASVTSSSTIFTVILIVLFIVFVIFVIRRILRLRKLSKGKTGKLWEWNLRKERFERTDSKKYKNRDNFK